MIIRSRRKAGASLVTSTDKTVEVIQPKKPVSKKSKGIIKPEVKTESQVEIKEDKEIIEITKKRSLLEEVLEESINSED